MLKNHAGFSLIELVVTVAVAGILLSLGMASFQVTMASTKTKTTSEYILSGLRKARSEAIKRNAPIRFQFVSALDATCTLSPASQLWVITQTNQNTGIKGAGNFNYGVPTSQCDVAPAIPPDFCTDTLCENRPYIAFTSTSKVSSGINVSASNVVAAVSTSVVTFGPLGQVLTNVEGTASITRIDIASSVSGAKAWRINVSPINGSIKLCDPAILTAGAPLACS